MLNIWINIYIFFSLDVQVVLNPRMLKQLSDRWPFRLVALKAFQNEGFCFIANVFPVFLLACLESYLLVLDIPIYFLQVSGLERRLARQ